MGEKEYLANLSETPMLLLLLLLMMMMIMAPFRLKILSKIWLGGHFEGLGMGHTESPFEIPPLPTCNTNKNALVKISSPILPKILSYLSRS